MAAALPFLAVGLQVIGGISAAQGAKADARAQAQASEFNAQINERNAVIARQQAAQDAETQRRQDVRTRGRAVASYGASGVTLEGSPIDVLEDMAIEQELGRQTIEYRGNLRAMGYTDEATLDRFSAGNALARGDRQATSILFGTAANVAKGAYDFWGGGPTKPTKPTRSR